MSLAYGLGMIILLSLHSFLQAFTRTEKKAVNEWLKRSSAIDGRLRIRTLRDWTMDGSGISVHDTCPARTNELVIRGS